MTYIFNSLFNNIFTIFFYPLNFQPIADISSPYSRVQIQRWQLGFFLLAGITWEYLE